MTKFKKIIPALCMLLISAVLMGTSTYAWFSMNTTVSATGMKVQAKSDATFLQIKADGDWNNTDAFTTATINSAKKEIRPTQAVKSVAEDQKSVVAFDGSSLVWVSTYSTDPSDADAGVGDSNLYTDVTKDAETSYVLKQTFTVRLKPNSGAETASNLKVISAKFAAVTQENTDITDGLLQSLRVLFVCGENKVIWKNDSFVAGSAESLLATSVTTSDLTIDVYVYFDGSDSACTTNNALTPDEYTLSFNLKVD